MAMMTGNRTPHEVGQLCVGADWAWAHGDFGALRDVAQRLAASAPEPFHCQLVALVELVLYDLDGAAALWARLKDELHHLQRP